MSRYPFARPKPRAKRKDPRRVIGRVRLYGEEKTELRRLAFERSGGKCEAIIYCEERECQPRWHELYHCGAPITWETMELSHKAHGPRKTDTLSGVIASCKDCHQKQHAGGKPVPRKAGRKMNQPEALAYWKATACFCGGEKPAQTSFCLKCMSNLSPQSQYDVMNATGKEWLYAIALAEIELLAWKPAEERQ